MHECFDFFHVIQADRQDWMKALQFSSVKEQKPAYTPLLTATKNEDDAAYDYIEQPAPRAAQEKQGKAAGKPNKDVLYEEMIRVIREKLDDVLAEARPPNSAPETIVQPESAGTQEEYEKLFPASHHQQLQLPQAPPPAPPHHQSFLAQPQLPQPLPKSPQLSPVPHRRQLLQHQTKLPQAARDLPQQPLQRKNAIARRGRLPPLPTDALKRSRMVEEDVYDDTAGAMEGVVYEPTPGACPTG